MRFLCFAATCCLVLTGCNQAPTFDTSSLAAFQRSLSAIKTSLSVADQQKLQIALLTLAAGNSADYTAYALANPAAIGNIETLEAVANPLTVLDRMRPIIQNRSAAAVIRRVADDLDYAIARTETQEQGADKVLAAFVIENARYSWDRSKRGTLPTVDFSIYNGSKNPISAVSVSGVLAGRTLPTPLVVGGGSYRFSGLLQPGVQERVTILFGVPGAWTAKQIESAYDVNLTLKISNINDADGKRLLTVNTDVLDTMRRKRAALRAS